MLSCILGSTWAVCAQTFTVKGTVVDEKQRTGIKGVQVYLEGNLQRLTTSSNGQFEFIGDCASDCFLVLEKMGYTRLRLPIDPSGEIIELGLIILSRKYPVEKRDVLLNLSESDLNEEDGVSDVVGFLQGSRDIFLNRAAFDFSQSFFRVRGYDSSEGQVQINGLPMNSIIDGRPQWNNWGGLNDVMRYATHSLNLEASRTSFEGLMGGVNYRVRPSQMRPGTRLTTSFSNRSYATRLMATHASGKGEGNLSFACSLSRRWAKEGYIRGTTYNAYSFFGSLELELNPYSSLFALAMLAYNRRGRSSPITQEVFNLAGRTYNPNWGKQGDRIRNARERVISEPVFTINYQLTKERFRLRIGLGYQFGNISSSRLGYFQAPNPDPTYYRYLPSFYFNNRFGDYAINAQKASEGFLSGGQLGWEKLYRANTNNPAAKASYITYSDVAEGRQITGSAIANLKLNQLINLDAGISYRTRNTENFARIDDLLGAAVHLDIEPFSDTQNDINAQTEKGVGDRFSYAYLLEARVLNTFIQLHLQQKKWTTFITAGWESTEYQREGLFLNARYPDESFGQGPRFNYAGFGLKAGVGYRPNARIQFNLRAALKPRLPTPKNLYINPRDNQKSLSYDILPTARSIEMNTLFRFPVLTGRISAYSTWFRNTSEIGFYFTDSGLGSDFVQEVLSGIDSWNRGLEFGLEFKPSSTVSLSLAGNIGSYQIVNNPRTELYFDVTEGEQNPIHASGEIDLGSANLKGIYTARGPQQAVSFGVTYRDPDYWFVSATINKLSRNFIDISVLPRTASFYLNPETGEPYVEIDRDFLEKSLIQKPLPEVYLFNLVGGKSWLLNGWYLGIFASVNNLFDTAFRSGGFEQSRNAHYAQFIKDKRSATPAFSPKYWYGYGRTYFLNLSLSF
ncbi:carboxypeptidase-like regulatory domain-containing protein [Flavobacteriaceae bacterium D16]|nr:carboxypeptidase-like regulatory domain-containing protein [Flavobacteriaceae bacterium D16]